MEWWLEEEAIESSAKRAAINLNDRKYFSTIFRFYKNRCCKALSLFPPEHFQNVRTHPNQ